VPGSRKKKALAFAVGICVALFPLAPAHGQAQPEAGKVTARIPEGQLVRPSEVLATDPGRPVLWGDLVRTSDRGRVRITLADSSILNVGSNSNLRVIHHNARTRETELELQAGRLRSRLQRLGPNQKFELKTNTAVMGVIGTDFFVETTPQFTRVIVYEGAVIISSISAAVIGSQTVMAGYQTAVFADQPPSPPQPAPRADIQQSQDDTDVGVPLPVLPPPSAAGRPPLLKNKWFWVAVAGGAAVAIGVVAGTRKRDVTGCPVPSSSSSSPSSSIAATTCPP